MKAVALADIELCLSEGISQSASQSVENLENSAKFCSNFLKAFQVTMHIMDLPLFSLWSFGN